MSPAHVHLGWAGLAGAAPGEGEGLVRVPLDPPARAALERISGGRDPERLIVVGACAIAALARAFGWGTFALASERFATGSGASASGCVSYEVELSAELRLAQLLGALDLAYLDAQAAPATKDMPDEVELGLGYTRPLSGRYALHLRVDTHDEALELRWDHARVAPAVAAALAATISQALRGLDDPSVRLDALELVDPSSLARLRALGRGSEPTTSRATMTVLERFSAAVARFPDRPALVDDEGTTSYAELDDRSRRLAAYLRATYQLEPGDLIGVLTASRPRAVEAILAILRAGAAWLPLDPRQPPARIESILRATTAAARAQPKLLLIDAERLFELDGLDGLDAELYALDVQREHLEAAPLHDAAAAGLDARAYVIATSGSTGTPKLVEVDHRAIANYIAWKIDYHALDEHAVRLQLAPIAFDSSISDLFSMLAVGGCLVTCETNERLDPEAFARRAEAAGVTIFAVVPSHYRVLLDALRPGALRSITVAGERVTHSLVEAHARRLPDVRLINEYGPSEATIAATACQLWPRPSSNAAPDRDPPIGGPISGAGVVVLDAAGCPAAPGLAGEIAVFGCGLARGYLGDAARTRASFVHARDPARGDRIYKTGDQGCWRDDGQLAFLGRVDDQLKIRGNRVELGEIEAAVRRHPAVLEAAVVPYSRADDERSLAAFVVTREVLPAAELRRFLAERLPRYMLPALIEAVPEMPRTPNAKLDRRALIAQASAPRSSQADQPNQQAPTAAELSDDPIASGLLAIWREVLGIEKVGVDDNFFELGGHSLQATRLVARARAELGRELPLRALFRRPTVRALARLMAEAPEPARAQLQPAADAPDYPASETQRRLWALARLGPSGAYVMCEAFEAAALGRQELHAALAELARRHEILRTSLHARGAEVRQRVAAHIEPPLSIRTLPPRSRDAELRDVELRDVELRDVELRELAARELAIPFELERAPLWRCVLVESAGAPSVVLLLLHHVISDGHSIGTLLDELCALVLTAQGSNTPALPEPTLQYRDFACWSATRLASPEGQADRQWWLEELADAAPGPGLALDHPRPPSARRPGAELRRALDPALLDRLDQLTRAHAATRFAGLVALVAIWLRRVSEAEAPVLGTVFGARERPELARVLGPMLATLPLRCPVALERGLAAAIERCAAVTRGAFAHAEQPFDLLLEALALPRARGRHPLFDVMVTIDDQVPAALVSGGAFQRIEPERLFERWTAKFDLTIALRPTAAGHDLIAEYDAELFEPARIERALDQLLSLLRAGLDDPAAPIATLTMLGAREGEALARFARSQPPRPITEGIVARFDQRVAQRPAHPAIVSDDARWTYAELREASLAVAASLCARGLGPDHVIATALGRGPEAVITWLAILRVGAVYLPLEPAWPGAHVLALLDAAQARALIVDHRCPPPALEPGDSFARLELRELLEHQVESPPPPTPTPGPEAPAYLMFTSGSTGAPRGALIDARSVVNLADAYAEAFAIDADARVALTASVGFDASIAELWPALLAGATVLPIDEERRRDLSALVRWLSEQRISHSYLPTAIVSLLGSLRGPAFRLDDDLTIITGGEALELERLPVARLANAYGPTECGVCATWAWVRADELPGAPTIGRPLTNVEVLVLDDRAQLVPIGVDGEICVAGVGLARELVGPARGLAFATHPLDARERIYRTGDRGRWLDDGRLQFRGRRDRQLAVRGHRLEPAMIERPLLEHPAITAACVVNSTGSGGLVAFVTARAGAELEPEALRDHIAAALPAYMVPDQIELWPGPELPLTQAGKLDRAALRAVQVTPRAPNLPSAEHPLLRIVCQLWAEVLDHPQLGPDDDFFELGGHSLTAMELCARLSAALELELPVRALFEHPRPLALTRELERLRGAAQVRTRPPLSVEPEGPWPLSATQAQLLHLQLRIPTSAALNLELRLRARGPLASEALATACERLSARHPILGSRFDAEAGEARRGPHDPGCFAALELVDVEPSKRELIAQLVLAREAERPFALSEGPPWRLVALSLTPTDHIVQIVAHHIAADARSLEMLRDELLALYAETHRELSPELSPEPDPSYGDLARWQRRCLAEGLFAPELDYWRRCLATPLPRFLPPASIVDPEHGPLASARVELSLSLDDLAQLRALAQRASATLFMVALAGLAATLAQHSPASEVRITTNLSTRARPEARAMLGPLVNTAILRFELRKREDRLALLRQARTAVLDAFAHRELPFEVAVAEQDPETQAALASAFPVMFLFGDADGPELPTRVAELELESLEPDEAAGDATLMAAELLFSCDISRTGARLALVYKRRTCTPEQASSYLERLRRELAGLVASVTHTQQQEHD